MVESAKNDLTKQPKDKTNEHTFLIKAVEGFIRRPSCKGSGGIREKARSIRGGRGNIRENAGKFQGKISQKLVEEVCIGEFRVEFRKEVFSRES